jgi:hypothetical protein
MASFLQPLPLQQQFFARSDPSSSTEDEVPQRVDAPKRQVFAGQGRESGSSLPEAETFSTPEDSDFAPLWFSAPPPGTAPKRVIYAVHWPGEGGVSQLPRDPPLQRPGPGLSFFLDRQHSRREVQASPPPRQPQPLLPQPPPPTEEGPPELDLPSTAPPPPPPPSPPRAGDLRNGKRRVAPLSPERSKTPPVAGPRGKAGRGRAKRKVHRPASPRVPERGWEVRPPSWLDSIVPGTLLYPLLQWSPIDYEVGGETPFLLYFLPSPYYRN